MLDKSPPEVNRPSPAPIRWGRQLYFSMLVVIGLLATYPAYNHFRIRGYEALRHEITAAGAKAPRAGGGSRTADQVYWSSLGGDLDRVVIRHVEYPPFAPVQLGILARLRRCPDLAELRLDGQLLDARLCREVFRMRQLEVLRVGYCELADEWLAGLEKLEYLHTLDLAGTTITDASLDRLARLTNLTELDLRNTEISSAGAARLAQALPQTQIRHHPWPSAAHRQACLRLFRAGADVEVRDDAAQGLCIRLHRHQWRGTLLDLEDLAEMRDVELLELGGLDLEPPLLSAVARLPNISRLSIARCPVRGAELSLLGDSASIRQVSLVDVFAEPAVIDQLAGIRELESLALVNARTTPGSLAAIARLPALCELSLINMRFRGNALAELAGAGSLKKLELARTSIDDSQVEQICLLGELESLGLNGTQVTDASIPRLAQLSHLRRLDVSNTRLSKTGIEQLQSAIPDCHIATQTEELHQIDVMDLWRDVSQSAGP